MNVTVVATPIILDAPIDYAYWIGLFAHGIAAIIPIAYGLFSRAPSAKEIKVSITAAILAIATFMNISLLIDQGRTTRSDGVVANYGVWAFESVAFLLYGLLVGYTYRMHQSTRVMTGILSGAVGVGLLLSSISTGDAVYAWLSMACVVYILLVVITSLYPKTDKTQKAPGGIPVEWHILKGLFLVNVGAYIVIYSLSGSASSKLSDLVAAIVYLILDLMRVGLCLSVIFDAFKSVEHVSIAPPWTGKEEPISFVSHVSGDRLPLHKDEGDLTY